MQFVGFALGAGSPTFYASSQWNDLATALGVQPTDSLVTQLKRRVDWVSLGSGSVEFAKHVETASTTSGAAERKDLAALDVADWVTLMAGVPESDFPADLKGS